MGSKAYVRNHRFCDIELMTRDPLRLNHPWKGPWEGSSVYIHILRSLSAKQWTMTKCVSAILWCSSRPSFLKGKPPIFKNSGEKEINEALLVWKKKSLCTTKRYFSLYQMSGKNGNFRNLQTAEIGWNFSENEEIRSWGRLLSNIIYASIFFLIP